VVGGVDVLALGLMDGAGGAWKIDKLWPSVYLCSQSGVGMEHLHLQRDRLFRQMGFLACLKWSG
jgi:hypothetical protein